MKITILNHSDSQGGAAIVTLRLLQALRRLGAEARMLVMHKRTDSPYVKQVGPEWEAKAAFLGERADIFLQNGLSRKNLFKVSTAKYGLPLSKHPWVEDADIVMLSWVNQGMISLKEIARIKAPVIWVMHDMWCLTGICHHAGTCERYYDHCGGCPFLNRKCEELPNPTHDLSWHTWKAKAQLYCRKKIEFVAVSNWLAERSKNSALMQDQSVPVIPNAISTDEFYVTPKRSRESLGLPSSGKIIAMGAARLDDPIKGLDLAIEALNQITDTDAHAVFFGALRNPAALNNLKLPYTHLGSISDPLVIREIYAHATVVFSSSHYETLPSTLIEGMASGCVPVSFNQGGQADIIEHLSTGYIAQYPDVTDLANGLRMALSGELSPMRLREAIERKFGAKAIATRYLDLAESIIRKGIRH